MKKTTVALAVILIALVATVSVYGVFEFSLSPRPSPSPSPNVTVASSTSPSSTLALSPSPSFSPVASASPSPSAEVNTTLTVVDGTGHNITVTTPVTRIISFAEGSTEVICALGCEDLIVGRDYYSNLPPSVLSKPDLGLCAYYASAEKVLDLQPDLIIADTTIGYNEELLTTIQNAGIPMMIEVSNNATQIKNLATNLGLFLNKQDNAQAIINYIDHYANLVSSRIANLTDSEKPLVYYEDDADWQSCSTGSGVNGVILAAGGVNIAGGQNVSFPTLSPEFVTEQNPTVIVRAAEQGVIGNFTEFQSIRNGILTRAGLTTTDAVENGRVYISTYDVFEGMQYPVGLLYWAKWFNPSLFADIDPAAAQQELYETFFGVEPSGPYVYPAIVTVTDFTGADVTVNLPVTRVVCLNDGLTEAICALSSEDKIVGRPTNYGGFPSSVLAKPEVGDSLTPNLEEICDLKPDLIVSDSSLCESPEIWGKIKDLNIPVIIENSANPTRVDTIVTNFGLIFDNSAKAAQIVATAQNYTNLVNTRLQNVSSTDRVTFYYAIAGYDWLTMANGSDVNTLLVNCGGINIAANSTVTYPTLSPEYVVEANPDVIIVEVDYGKDLAAYQSARNDILNNPALSDVTAIKEGRVYCFSYSITTGVQYPVGTLYFAKWLYPTLFADIDPAAVHAQLIQDYFGVPLEDMYAYSG
jgi:iron complex transport system substrate-binding protein